MASASEPFWHSPAAEDLARPCLLTEDRVLTYGEVFAAADALWQAAAGDSGPSGGVAVILCDKTVETILAYLGALRAGVVPLLLDAASRPEALERAFLAYQPDYIFSPVEGFTRAGFTLAASLGPAQLWRAQAREATQPHPDLALLLPTSGSTGDPKCVRVSHASLQACTAAICDYLEMAPDRRSVSLLPLHYSYGLSVLHITLAARASMVVTPRSVLDRALWTMVEDLGITDLSGVPFMFEALRRMKFSEAVLAQLTCVTQAGGRLDPKITRHFQTLFGAAGVKYFTMYGQTEASPRIAYLPPEYAETKEGSVGIPLACGRAEIAETGAAEGEGELVYSGPNVALGYASQRADLALGDTFQGRLYTGDQVRIDADGFIFIIGRRKRFIKLQGMSVNLDHVESLLKAQEIDCLVIGRENRMTVCYTGAQEGHLTEVLKRNFAFHPSTLRLQPVEAMPLNASGKPDYARLSDAYL